VDVRNQILTHATKLFAERGYDGTSVQEIANAVGIRKPSLLYHFKSKDELREHVISEMLAHWNAVLPSLLLNASREERFDATMEALSRFFIEDPDRARLILRETLDRPEYMQTMLANFVRPWIHVFT
jgi:AcrR family transcriptional regulator